MMSTGLRMYFSKSGFGGRFKFHFIKIYKEYIDKNMDQKQLKNEFIK